MSNGLIWFDKIGGMPVRVSIGDYGRDQRDIKKVEKVINGSKRKIFHVIMQSAQGKSCKFIIHVDKGKSERFVCTEGEIQFPLAEGSEIGVKRETGKPSATYSNSKMPKRNSYNKGDGGLLTSCLTVPTDNKEVR